MARPKVTLFTDVRSGFSYLVFNVLQRSSVFRDVEIDYIPVDLRALWQACNNQGAWPVRNKPAWIIKSVQMWARKFQIPFNGPPNGFAELSTTQLQKTLCVVAQDYPDRLTTIMHAVLDVFWVRSEPAHESAVFSQILQEILGAVPAQQVLEKAETSAAEEMLKHNTDDAFAAGAFGLPYIQATNTEGRVETFFGFDHLGLVADFLGVGRPTSLLDNPMNAGWAVLL